jgi:6-methylsalicylate decarboxylase
VPGIPIGSIEYGTDTTRTIAHLVFSGTVTRYPAICWIFSHSGGTLPFLTGRFIRLADERRPEVLPNGPLPKFHKFHYEMAQRNTPGQIAALLKMVPLEQVLCGTDYPFWPGAEVNPGKPPLASAPPTSNRPSAAPRSSCCRGSKPEPRRTPTSTGEKRQ